jgi:hypothetical protein
VIIFALASLETLQKLKSKHKTKSLKEKEWNMKLEKLGSLPQVVYVFPTSYTNNNIMNIYMWKSQATN